MAPAKDLKDTLEICAAHNTGGGAQWLMETGLVVVFFPFCLMVLGVCW